MNLTHYFNTTSGLSIKAFRGVLNTSPLHVNIEPFQKVGTQRCVIRKGQVWPIHLPEGRYPFILNTDAEIRFPIVPNTEIRHPELNNGNDVISAGMFHYYQGLITLLSNESGHYCPEANGALHYALLAFAFWKLPLSEDLELKRVWHLDKAIIRER